MADRIVTEGRVVLVDPNQIAAENPELINATPPYQELTPYVEFQVIRRRDTVINIRENGRYDLEETGGILKVNLLNFDEEEKAFTAGWASDKAILGATNQTATEGFGIKNIQVKMNSNYIPMVTAQFMDIRGTSLMGPGDKSPMSVLFDFPPPIYKLRLKGAYGLFVEYDLQMHNHEFQYDEGGSFMIEAKFIGSYFGPLNDILLGHLKAVPYLKGQKDLVSIGNTTTSSVNGDSSLVNSFHELVNRGAVLYTAVDTYQKDSNTMEESRKLTGISTELDGMFKLISGLANEQNSTFVEFSKGRNAGAKQSKVTIGVGSTENSLKYSFTKDPQGVAELNATREKLSKISGFFSRGLVGADKGLSTMIEDFLEERLLRALETQFSIIGKESTSAVQLNFRDGSLLKIKKTDTDTEYSYEVDYTALVQKVGGINDTNKGKEYELRTQAQEQLRSITDGTLGVPPTIGNIFKVILDDFDYLLRRIKEAGEEAKQTTKGGLILEGEKPWPYVMRGTANEQNQDPTVYPGTDDAFKSWGEVRLVEEYCRSLTEQAKVEQEYENFQQAIDPSKFIPVSPIEVFARDDEFKNSYLTVSNLNDLYEQILLRFISVRDYGYGPIFTTTDDIPYKGAKNWFLNDADFLDKEERNQLIRSVAKTEAHNVGYAINGHEDLVSAILNPVNGNAESVMKIISTSRFGLLNAKVDGFQKTMKFRDTTLVDRGSPDFVGLLGIIDPLFSSRKSLYTQKTGGGGDEFEQDREQLMSQFARNFLGQVKESQVAKVTENNLLLFQDSKKKEGGSGSDFCTPVFSDTADVEADLYINIAKTALLNIRVATVNYDIDIRRFNDADKDAFFSQFKSTGNRPAAFLAPEMGVFEKFLAPGVVEIPRIVLLYWGYLLKTEGNKLDWLPSPIDTERIITYYNSFKMIGLGRELNQIWTDLSRFISGTKIEYSKRKEFLESLKTKMANSTVLSGLIQPVYIVNASAMTFMRPEKIEKRNFHSVKTLSGAIDPVLTVYLESFFTEIKNFLASKQDAGKAKMDAVADQLDDPDFKNGIYLRFKSIYDRWLAGKALPTEGMYERFKFITRSHQDISQACIVDFHSLIDDSKNSEMGVFTAMARLLQENKFQFYPLHSYMDFSGEKGIDQWENSFRITNKLSEDTISKPAFVCMHMGGFSSQLNTGNDNYKDDGFMFGKDQPSDFTTGDGSLFAFRLRVGSQNQSIFAGIKGSSTQFTATDVSLRMENDIINKQSQSNRHQKAQNLLDVYSQRSYSIGSSIPLGNMCIQPTQYFQLEGVPIFNGAYMVYQVEHRFEGNRLETSFQGYRMGRYIQRIVSDYLMSYTGVSGQIDEAVSGLSISTDTGGGSKGLFSGKGPKAMTDGLLQQLCSQYGYPVNVMKAIIDVETDGVGFDPKTGRVIINFETRRFSKKTGIDYASVAPDSGLRGQDAEYNSYNKAMRLNAQKTMENTSYGLGQILGENASDIGFKTVREFAEAMEVSEYKQIEAMFQYIKITQRRVLFADGRYITAKKGTGRLAKLSEAVKAADFDLIAFSYNGAAYWKPDFNYHVRLRKSYAYYSSGVEPANGQTLVLRREILTNQSTIGTLTHNGEFVCYVLEDAIRPKKIKNETAIPGGVFEVIINRSERFSARAGRDIFMPLLNNVPGYGGIRIHTGKDKDDSSGCLLVGLRKGTDIIYDTKEAYEKVYALIKNMLTRGKVRIDIRTKQV